MKTRLIAWLLAALAAGLLARPALATPLYDPLAPTTSLFSDPDRPTHIGDLVEIHVAESLSSIKVNNLTNNRGLLSQNGGTGAISSALSSVLGRQGVNLNGSTRQQTSRADNLETVVATRVTQILPNGYLQVEGERVVKLNRDEVATDVTGVVRPCDVNRDGVVESSKVMELQMLVKRKTPRGFFDNILKILF